MNTLTRSWLFLILMGIAVTFLPACGSKTNVKSEKAPETVLNDETPVMTPVSNGNAEIGLPGENTSIHTYVEKIHRTKSPKSGTTITTTPLASTTTAMTPVPTPAANQTPVMETTAPVKKSGGSHWLIWILVILVLALIGWYFWNKSREGHPGQPMPPTGGLSPVSGFTALKDKIEDETESKPSIWSKKIF